MNTAAYKIFRLPNSALALVSYSLVVVAAGMTLMYAALIAYVAMYDAPYWDLWQHVDRNTMLTDLFARNNEHPVVTSRLLFFADSYLFSSTSRFVQLVSLIELAVLVGLFVWLARMLQLARPILTVGAVSAVFVFYPFGFENTIWIFQVSLVLAFTSAVGGFVCFASYAASGSRLSALGSVLFSILAVLSFANGILVPTMLAPLAVWLRRPRAATAFAAIAAGGWIWQLSSYAPRDALSLEGVPMVASHYLAQLGAPIGWASGYLPRIGLPAVHNVSVAMFAGFVVLLLAVAALAYVAVKRRRDPAALAAAAIILFALTTSALVALGRYQMGAEQALSSRYNANAAILYLAILVTLMAGLAEAPAAIKTAAARASPVFAAGLVLLAVTSAPMLQDLAGRYRAGLAGLTALVAGARDEQSVGQLAFNYDMAVRETADFRRTNTWMFAYPTARRMGETLSQEEIRVPVCAGSSWRISAPEEEYSFRQADGLFARRSKSYGASHVLITDRSGLIVGYGRVPRRASDLNPFAKNDGRPVDWMGRVGANQQLPLFAWIADDRRVRCALGPAR
jgi:hypothetical protein